MAAIPAVRIRAFHCVLLLFALCTGGCVSTTPHQAPGLPRYDVRKATSYLRSRAKKRPAPPWECAEYTRQAIEAGGIVLERTRCAKDYGASLERAGFRKLPASEKPRAGDVVVFGAYERHREGHMAMFDGTQWISDFLQAHFWPGRDYEGAPFTIYRYRGGYAARNQLAPNIGKVFWQNINNTAVWGEGAYRAVVYLDDVPVATVPFKIELTKEPNPASANPASVPPAAEQEEHQP